MASKSRFRALLACDFRHRYEEDALSAPILTDAGEVLSKGQRGYQGGKRPRWVNFLSTKYAPRSVLATTREPGPGSIPSAGQAARQGITLQRYLSALAFAVALPASHLVMRIQLLQSLLYLRSMWRKIKSVHRQGKSWNVSQATLSVLQKWWLIWTRWVSRDTAHHAPMCDPPQYSTTRQVMQMFEYDFQKSTQFMCSLRLAFIGHNSVGVLWLPTVVDHS